MRCDEARALLLEAEPEELAGAGDAPLAVHLRECAGCAAATRVLLGQSSLLDEALAAQPPVPDVEAILARAGVPAPARARAPRRGWRGIAPRRALWGALSAAAATAALLLLRPDVPPTRLATAHAPTAPPVVESSSSPGVAVIATDDPDITVVWFF